jgi:hypothetical protein
MSTLLYEVNSATDGVVFGRKLGEVFAWAAGDGASVDPDSEHLLRKAAIDYAQLKVQRARFELPDRPRLLLGLRQAVDRSCREGFLQPDEQAVMWFAHHQGEALACARTS